MSTFNRILVVFILVAASGLVSHGLGSLVAERAVSACDTETTACQ